MESGANASNASSPSGRTSPNRSPLLMSPATGLPVVNALGLQSNDPRYARRSDTVPLHQVPGNNNQYGSSQYQVVQYPSYPQRSDTVPSPTYSQQPYSQSSNNSNYGYPPYASPYPPQPSHSMQSSHYAQSVYPQNNSQSRMHPSERPRNMMGGVPAYPGPSPTSYPSSFPDHPSASSAAASAPSSGHATPNTYHRDMHSHSPQNQTGGSQVVLDYAPEGHHHSQQSQNNNFGSYPSRSPPPILPPIHASYRSTAQQQQSSGVPMGGSPPQNGNGNSNSYGVFPAGGEIGGPGKWRPYAVPVSDAREL